MPILEKGDYAIAAAILTAKLTPVTTINSDDIKKVVGLWRKIYAEMSDEAGLPSTDDWKKP
jgi:hypothetical protein